MEQITVIKLKQQLKKTTSKNPLAFQILFQKICFFQNVTFIQLGASARAMYLSLRNGFCFSAEVMINFFFLKLHLYSPTLTQADIHFMFHGKGQDIGYYASKHKTHIFGIIFLVGSLPKLTSNSIQTNFSLHLQHFQKAAALQCLQLVPLHPFPGQQGISRLNKRQRGWLQEDSPSSPAAFRPPTAYKCPLRALRWKKVLFSFKDATCIHLL